MRNIETCTFIHVENSQFIWCTSWKMSTSLSHRFFSVRIILVQKVLLPSLPPAFVPLALRTSHKERQKNGRMLLNSIKAGQIIGLIHFIAAVGPCTSLLCVQNSFALRYYESTQNLDTCVVKKIDLENSKLKLQRQDFSPVRWFDLVIQLKKPR